uniref:Small integral membrane protein 15 n=9 Tax=Neoaves TaxID=3078114 RepID=A0A8C3JW82_9CHAR
RVWRCPAPGATPRRRRRAWRAAGPLYPAAAGGLGVPGRYGRSGRLLPVSARQPGALQGQRDLGAALPSLGRTGGCPRRRWDPPPPQGFPSRKPEKMIDIKAWAEYIVEWAAKDPYGFLTTVILALTPLFVISAALSWKLAKMIEAREREQKKKQKRQENIAKAKRTKKD